MSSGTGKFKPRPNAAPKSIAHSSPRSHKNIQLSKCRSPMPSTYSAHDSVANDAANVRRTARNDSALAHPRCTLPRSASAGSSASHSCSWRATSAGATCVNASAKKRDAVQPRSMSAADASLTACVRTSASHVRPSHSLQCTRARSNAA